jgi:hypothetical protein
MNITLCSSFRTSYDYLRRYYQQALALRDRLQARGDALRFVWGEGDSVDGTLTLLRIMAGELGNVRIVDCTHGGPAFGSVVNAARFKQLAYVAKRIWAAIPADTDVMVWVESDLVWDAATMVSLIDHCTPYPGSSIEPYPAISPMVFLQRAGWRKDSFYDTFAAVGLDGQHFDHHAPYHASYDPSRPFQVRSMGSCMAMRGEIARRITFDDNTIFPDICRQITFGGSGDAQGVYIDPGLSVYHQ